LQYYTNHTDLGAPEVTTILKKLAAVVIGGSNQAVITKWGYDFTQNYQAQNSTIVAQDVSFYNDAQYNVSSYASGVLMTTLTVYPTGFGKVIQVGYEADINGSPLSIQKIEIQAKTGKIA
jgi:hypothetical protein